MKTNADARTERGAAAILVAVSLSCWWVSPPLPSTGPSDSTSGGVRRTQPTTPLSPPPGRHAIPGPRKATNPGNYFNSAPGVGIDNGWMVSNGHATGNNSSIVITQSGIYYSPKTGNKAIDLKGVTTAPDVTVTFVAEGQIELNGAASITGHAPVAAGGYSPLLMFSNAGGPPACNVNAIQYSGNGISWSGLMFAPKGEIQMSSSSNVSVFGSIIAHSVSISGSDFKINWQDDTSGAPRFIVELQS